MLEVSPALPDDPDLKNIMSPAFAKVTVVPPFGSNDDQVLPKSVEYSSVTDGGEPVFAMLTVAPASSALT